MRKIKKRRPTTAQDLGLKIIVLKGPSPYAGKVLFPEELKIANEVLSKLVDKSGNLIFQKKKNNPKELTQKLFFGNIKRK